MNLNDHIRQWLTLFLVLALVPLFLLYSQNSTGVSRVYATGPNKLFFPLIASNFGGPTLGGCSVFSPNNPWNRDVSNDLVDPNSNAYIASIGSNINLHPDFGSNLTYGIPYTIVSSIQVSVPITYYPPPDGYGDESDPGPYPIPPNAVVESGSDAHVLVAQSGLCKLYELFNASKDPSGPGWFASSGAIFSLNSNALRPDYWTSADAAGLPILPGLVRYDEVQSGVINHALRFTAVRTQHAFIHPATHWASSYYTPTLPPMGLRLRLKASYPISGFTGNSKIILTALKKYGMFVADNGSNWFISGSTDGRWNDTDLNQMKTVPGSAFEVVQAGTIITH